MDSSRESVCHPRVAKEKQPVATHDAPFRDVAHAVSFAYRLEDTAILKISSALSDLRASEIRGAPMYETPWDRHAQAALIIRTIRRSRYKNIIEAKFRKPTSLNAITDKHMDCEKVANEFVNASSPFVVYCVCDWANIRLPKGWVKVYARVMDCSKRTLYRQRTQVFEALDNTEGVALKNLDIVMRDAGLIE